MAFGRTQLHEAIISGNITEVNSLVKKGFDIDALDNENQTPLHWAVWKCSTELISILLGRGANYKLRDYKGRTPLKCALAYKSHNISSILREFIRHGVRSSLPLFAITASYRLDSIVGLANTLIELRADIKAADKDGRTALHYAAESGSEETVQ